MIRDKKGYPGSGMKRGISPIGDEKRDGKHVLTKS
jgi:hypothetical protein